MHSSTSAKYVFIAASLVVAFLLQGVPDRVLADTTHVETIEWTVHAGVNMDQCSGIGTLDYSSCSNGQHCANCYVAVRDISVVIDPSSETISSLQPIPYLQVDNPPQLKPPRIS